MRMNSGHVYGEEYTLRGGITPERKRQQRDDLVNECGFVI